MNIKNEKYKLDERPIDPDCACPVCRSFRAPICATSSRQGRCLPCALRYCITCNFYNALAGRIRQALDEGCFADFRAEYSPKLAGRL